MRKMCLNHGFSDKQFVSQGTGYKRPRSGDCEGTRRPSRGSASQSGRRFPRHRPRIENSPGRLGKVIGRQGRTAEAIRTLLSAAGMKLHKRYTLEILDED